MTNHDKLLILHLLQLSWLVINVATSTSEKPCRYDFSVYVYPLSPEITSLKLAEEARNNRTYHICRKCIYEQFALEYVIYDFFTQFCGRTYSPEKADYFYLPIVRDIDYRIALQNGGKRNPSLTENALLEAIEKKNFDPWNNYLNVTDRYWKRNGGADHILAMPAPVTNLRHQTSMRGFFHYMIQLEAPIFLNVEFSRSFVKEYPICASQKNIVMPYPTTDPEVLRGHVKPTSPLSVLPSSSVGSDTEPSKRDNLLFYQGGRHGSCEEVRNALSSVMSDKSIAIVRGSGRREEGFKNAKFCPIPIGDSPSSKRMYDVMNHGCVPVVLSDDLVWAYSTETGGFLDPDSFSIQLPQKTVQRTVSQLMLEVDEKDNNMRPLPSGVRLFDLLKYAESGNSSGVLGSYTTKGSQGNALVEILSRIPPGDLLTLQRGVDRASSSYRFYQYNSSMSLSDGDIPTSTHKFPDGDAIEVLGQILSLKKKRGILADSKDCQVERLAPGHKYVGNYPCDKAPKSKSVTGNLSKGRKKKNPF